jgi:hypothetical protein|uniref:Uncharacterized protein n=1 Tax=Fagus sylvatica TaxID=28930 RepID=A0A2N9GP49_FAGSY
MEMKRREMSQLTTFFANKMIVNLDVFCACMEDRVGCESNGTSIVTPPNRRRREWNMKVFKKHTDPIEISCGNGHGTILGLSAGASHYRLLLCTSRHKTSAKEDAEANGGLAIIRISSPIRVTESMKSKRAFGEEQTMIKGTLEIP